MGTGADRHHRPPRLGVIDDAFHLIVGQVAKPQTQHHDIGVVEHSQTGNVLDVVRVDLAGLGIDREQHRRLEPVVGGEDLRQLRKRLFAPVFVVARDQHDVFVTDGRIGIAGVVNVVGGFGGETRKDRQTQGDRSETHRAGPAGEGRRLN